VPAQAYHSGYARIVTSSPRAFLSLAATDHGAPQKLLFAGYSDFPTPGFKKHE